MPQNNICLLICRDEADAAALTAAMPASLAITWACSIEVARQELERIADKPAIIVAEAEFIPILTSLLQENPGFQGPSKPALVAWIDQASGRESALQAGADDYLLKPPLPSEIEYRLSRLLQARELNSAHSEEQTLSAQIVLFVILSRLLSENLDLNLVLARALEQTLDLFYASAGEIWLFSPDKESLDLVSSLSQAPFHSERPSHRSRGQGLLSRAINQDRPVVSNNVYQDPAYDPKVDQIFPVQSPTSALLVRLINRNEEIGLLALYKTMADSFTPAEATLLENIAPLVASAIANARLMQSHARTISLMKERDQLQRQIVQNERLRTIGLLTASLAHEINNPLQVIQGALALALEDLHKSRNIEEYILLSQQEAERVANQISRLRHLYRPAVDQSGQVNLPQLLNEIIELCATECKHHQLQVTLNPISDLPTLLGSYSQFQLALISIFLHIIENSPPGGGDVTIGAYVDQDNLRVELITQFSSSMEADPGQTDRAVQMLERDEKEMDLLPAKELIRATRGELTVSEIGDQTIWCIEWSQM